MYKIITSLSICMLIIACNQNKQDSTSAAVDGQAIYKKYCILCHGADGKLGINGAKDITVSTLTEAERSLLIKTGKNTMTPFEGVLTPEEIQAVAAFSMTIK